jgi:hypothetical protein
MPKHAKKSDHLQIAESQKALVEVPLPLLGALTSTRNAFSNCASMRVARFWMR